MKTFTQTRNPDPVSAHPRFASRTAANHQRIRIRQALDVPRPQARLQVGAPDDVYEREADRVANQVMRMAEPGSERIQRVCPECETELQRQPIEEEEEEMQAKARPGNDATIPAGTESAIDALRGGGQPLGNELRRFFEPRFGHDFGGVRVHSDNQAASAADAVNARAFTLGNDIVFGPGEYSPGTSEGRRLVAHELTHVVQQGR